MTSNQWWRPLVYAIAGLAVGALSVLLIWSLVVGLQVLRNIDAVTGDIRETQKGSRSLLDLIKDCTEPEGQCYQESQARAAEQAGAFNAAVIATGWCLTTGQDETYHQLVQCVGDLVDKRKEGP
jgi:hypothetical protein